MHVEGGVLSTIDHIPPFTSGSSQKISEPFLTSFCYNIFGLTEDYVKPRMHCISINMAPHTAGISLAHHNQCNLQKSILYTYLPITVYARIGMHDLSPEIENIYINNYHTKHILIVMY
jgi:hypothetical protein